MSDTGNWPKLESRLKEIQQRGIGPGKELWPGIAERLNQTRPKPSDKPPFWYGALAASVVIATFLTGWQLSTQRSIERPVSSLYLLAEEMNAEQQQQLHLMRVGYENAGYRQLDGEIKEQLAQLALARQKITESLRNSPGDPNLLELLRWVNEEELKLLSQSYMLRKTLREI